MRLLRLLLKPFLVKYYTTIHDLPAYNWLQMEEKKDLSYIFRDRETKITKRRAYKLRDIHYNLDREALDFMGISDKQKKYFLKKKQHAKAILDLIITGDLVYKTRKLRLEKEIAAMLEEITAIKKTIYTDKITIEKVLFNGGGSINLKTTTTAEYLTYIKEVNKLAT